MWHRSVVLARVLLACRLKLCRFSSAGRRWSWSAVGAGCLKVQQLRLGEAGLGLQFVLAA